MNRTPHKHILVISDPPAAPGFLPRLRYMCDFLVRKGYEITLLTEQYQPLVFAHSYPIITIPMYSGGLFDWTVKTIWTLLTDWHNRAFARKAFANRELRITNHDFDLVLCTAFSDFPLGAAKRIADRLQIPLLCDIRDLDEQVDNSRYQYHHQTWWAMPFRRLYRAIHICRRNQVLRKADAITTVSPWHQGFIKTFNPNVHLIYNGYDLAQFYPKNLPAKEFRITYIGSLFDWQQPALHILKQAINELTIPVILDIHTPHQNPVQHNQLGDTIRLSCIMLVLTNPRTKGMLTTKFYEALGCGKPILCIPSDQGELAKLIDYTQAGIATSDKEQIKAFITHQYQIWQEKGFTHQNALHCDQFSRETQSEKLERIIQAL